LDGTDSDAVLRKTTWGLDVAGQNGQLNSLEEAGGIGGLLTVYDTNGTTTGQNPTEDDKTYVYLYDANGNVGQLVDWSDIPDWEIKQLTSAQDWHADRLVARYEYDPYGNVVGPDTDSDGDWTDDAGPYATVNPFRFSTKQWDDETGLGYWGYRYYSPTLGRWISRDPIGERGGVNLYVYLSNILMTATDALGLVDHGMAGLPGHPETALGPCPETGESHRNKAHLRDRLSHFLASRSNDCYYGILAPIINKLILAIDKQVDFVLVQQIDDLGEYHTWGNHIVLSPDVGLPTIVHELIHAYVDYEGTYDDSPRKDEGIAHATTAVVTALKWLEKLDEQIRSGSCDVGSMRTKWQLAWRHINNANNHPAEYTWLFRRHPFNTTATDMQHSMALFGYRISCAALAKCYTKKLSRNGCPCSPEFVCTLDGEGLPCEIDPGVVPDYP